MNCRVRYSSDLQTSSEFLSMSVSTEHTIQQNTRFVTLQWLREHPGLWAALVIGLGLKIALLATNSITFDGDEAILALMARHIANGQELPLFFYGQRYMGALDAYLIAGMFLLFGESVLAVRLTQVVLYLGVVATTYFLGLWFGGSDSARHALPPQGKGKVAGTAAAMLVAFPPIVFSLYTTSTLGDYVEVLLLNNLIWLVVFDIFDGRKTGFGWWLLAGVLAGLGWWSMGLIIVSLIPLAAIGLWRYRKGIPWAKLGALVAGFVVGAAPWIGATLSGSGGGDTVAEQSTIDALSGSWVYGNFGASLAAMPERALVLFGLNIPSLFGLRPSWSLEWVLLPVGVVVAAFYVFTLWQSIREIPKADEDKRRMLWTFLGGWVVLLMVFIVSPFGRDVTGRYLIPLYPILAVLVGVQAAKLKNATYAPLIIVCVICGYNLWGNVRSMVNNPPGLTTQIDPITRIPHDQDDDLMAFLEDTGGKRGYSNLWVTYRFAFISGEEIIFSARLPDKENLSIDAGVDRYEPYTRAVDEADEVVYVTSNHPVLDAVLRQRFEAAGVDFEEESIGPYTVFYDLSRHITPEELGPLAESQE